VRHRLDSANVSHLFLDPASGLRDYIERALSADRRTMCSEADRLNIAEWSKVESNRKVIMEVIKSRLDLGWPYSYKALDLLSIMPLAELIPLHDKLKAFNDSANTVEGHSDLKKAAKPLLDKVEGEKKKIEEEEVKKKQEAILQMWGGLWTNEAGKTGVTPWGGYQYPYQVVPGVPAQAGVPWMGQPPSGWQPWVLTPTRCICLS
jgi:hypothetical protein